MKNSVTPTPAAHCRTHIADEADARAVHRGLARRADRARGPATSSACRGPEAQEQRGRRGSSRCRTRRRPPPTRPGPPRRVGRSSPGRARTRPGARSRGRRTSPRGRRRSSGGCGPPATRRASPRGTGAASPRPPRRRRAGAAAAGTRRSPRTTPRRTAAPRPRRSPATSTPASTGPAMLETEKLMPRSAFAGWSWPGCDTVCGSRPVNAGWKNASAVPYSPARTPSASGDAASGDQQRAAHRLDHEPRDVRGDEDPPPVAAVGDARRRRARRSGTARARRRRRARPPRGRRPPRARRTAARRA